jgi:hypothetical protein
MQGLGDTARWPRKNDKIPGFKDKSKWCAFHEDFGHTTEACYALRKETSCLFSKGYLKELLGKRKNKAQDTRQDTDQDPERATSPPPNASVIYFISVDLIYVEHHILPLRDMKRKRSQKMERDPHRRLP